MYCPTLPFFSFKDRTIGVGLMTKIYKKNTLYYKNALKNCYNKIHPNISSK